MNVITPEGLGGVTEGAVWFGCAFCRVGAEAYLHLFDQGIVGLGGASCHVRG